MKITIHIFIVVVLVLVSCSPEENVVSPNQDSWTLFSVPMNENALYSERVSGSELSIRKKLYASDSKIGNMYIYRDQLYLLLRNAQRMIADQLPRRKFC